MPKPVVKSKTIVSANKYSTNFWGMIQNVLIASLNKGQLMIGFVGMILLVMTIKMSSSDIKDVLKDVIVMAKDWHNAGWILLFIVTVSSAYLLRRARNLHDQQLKRLENTK